MDLEKTDAQPADGLQDAALPHATDGQGPWQFDLKTLFLVMTAMAVALSLLVAVPPIVRFISAGFLVLALPLVLTVVLIYGRGYRRTFCIGALFPAGLAVWPLGSYCPLLAFGLTGSGGLEDAGYVPAIFVAITFAASGVFGLMAIGVRRLVEGPVQK